MTSCDLGGLVQGSDDVLGEGERFGYSISCPDSFFWDCFALERVKQHAQTLTDSQGFTPMHEISSCSSRYCRRRVSIR